METWKPVQGYEGSYEVSDYGNVRTLIQKPPRLLKPGTGTSGYKYVNLSKKGKQLPKQVHRLVLESFEGSMDGLEGNHKNGIKTDNRLENLERVTRSENMIHRVRVLGMIPIIVRGEDSGNSRFTDKQVLEIRRLYDPKKRNGAKLARQFQCTKSAIFHIVKRRSWIHI